MSLTNLHKILIMFHSIMRDFGGISKTFIHGHFMELERIKKDHGRQENPILICIWIKYEV